MNIYIFLKLKFAANSNKTENHLSLAAVRANFISEVPAAKTKISKNDKKKKKKTKATTKKKNM